MAANHNSHLDKLYRAKTPAQIQAAYDDWAQTYEADVFAYGYRATVVATTIWARFVKLDEGPVLDAACGTGLQAEPLSLAGYGPICGIDVSEGMLEIARQKNIYAELHRMALGETLAFEDDAFANTISVGAITPGHAPPNSFDELIRVTGKGGAIIFSMRVDDGQDPAYPAAIAEHEEANRWSQVFTTKAFPTMPAGKPDVLHKIFVYRIT